MRCAPVRMRDLLKEQVGKMSQIFLAIKVVDDLHAGSVLSPIQAVRRGLILAVNQGVKKENSVYEIVIISRFEKKPCFSGDQQLRNSGDCGREYDFSESHRLHQN